MVGKFGFLFLLTGFALVLCTTGCGRQDTTENIAENTSEMVASLTDKTMETYQKELLVLTFETATAIPREPHIKDRSRTQEKVVLASLQLDQPLHALSCIEKIENWRRGAGYGDLALYCARHGFADEAKQYANLAIQISESAEDWRRDHIRGKIANTYTMLEQTREADQYGTHLADAESGKVAVIKAMIAGEDAFDDQMNALNALLLSGKFDIVDNALKACAQLFNRFYDDVNRRSLVEEKMKTSWEKMPIFKRVEYLTELAGFALDHGDQPKSLELVNEAQTFMDGAQWRPEHRIPLASKLVTLRFRGGDGQKARTDADALLALFDSERDTIVNIDRAESLRSLAETYQSLGSTEMALTIYKRAVEEGVENPNARPRAEDLTDTCLSMALHEVAPDAELWTRIRQIYQGLGEPW